MKRDSAFKASGYSKLWLIFKGSSYQHPEDVVQKGKSSIKNYEKSKVENKFAVWKL